MTICMQGGPTGGEFAVSDHHITHMREALAEAQQALAEGEFPVGCVLVQHDEIVPRGHRKNSRQGTLNELDHAEGVTLRGLLAQKPETNCGELIAYSTMDPCLMCYSTMLLSGIRHFVYGYEDVMGGGTNLPLGQLAPLYAQMHITVEGGVLREECLALFQQFFREYPYWRDSLLASYTLARKNEEPDSP
jgi:tRNA(adenine34) deaminase